MKRYLTLGLAVGLLGCMSSQSSGVAPLGATAMEMPPRPFASGDFAPGMPFPPVPPAPGQGNPAFSPERPRIGQDWRISGRETPGERLTFWLLAKTARYDNGRGDEDPLTSPDAIRLGEVVCDAKGDYALSVPLPQKLGPTRSGGTLMLQPGAPLRLRVYRGGEWAASYVHFLADEATVPLPSLPPLRFSVEGLDACGDEPLRVVGEGLTGKAATLVLRDERTRFGDSVQTEWSVPVDASGRVRCDLPLDPDPASPEGPVLTPDRAGFGKLSFLRLYDPESNRSRRLKDEGCLSALEMGLYGIA